MEYIGTQRSLCWACLHEGGRALSDAEAFSEALKLGPENKELQVAFREAVQVEFGVALNRDIFLFGLGFREQICSDLSNAFWERKICSSSYEQNFDERQIPTNARTAR